MASLEYCDDDQELLKIHENFKDVKNIVRIVKQSGWNGLLPSGYHLVQEIDTRFGTSFHVVQRFLKSASKVRDILESKNATPGDVPFDNLIVERDRDGEIIGFPALEAVSDGFEPVCDAQKELEAANYPAIHFVLPRLQSCIDELERIADGGYVLRDDGRRSVTPSRYSKTFCRLMARYLKIKVKVHDLWLLGWYLHPLLREFQFVPSLELRERYKERAENLGRDMIKRLFDGGSRESQPALPTNTEHRTGEVDHSSISPHVNNQTGIRNNNVSGRKRPFSLLAYADSHFRATNQDNELTRYSSIDVSTFNLDRKAMMEDAFGAIKFWFEQKGTFPSIYKLARKVYATPVSSCSSERVFSAVNRFVGKDKANLKSSTVDDIIVIRSALSAA